MANYKIEIIGSAVVITDTTAAVVHKEYPKRDIYYVVERLIEKDVIYLYDTNGTNSGSAAAAFEAPLANVVDGDDVAFTVASFRTFAQENLAFSSGGGATGVIAFKFTAVNYTDLTTNVAPTANEGELAIIYNSQGVWLVNRKLKGVYMYQSGVWEYANQELQTILQGKLDNVIAGIGISIDYTNPLEPIISGLKFNVDLDSAESSVTRVFAGGRTTFTVTHNLNTLDIKPEVFRISDGRTVGWREERTGVNTVEVSRNGNIADSLFRLVI